MDMIATSFDMALLSRATTASSTRVGVAVGFTPSLGSGDASGRMPQACVGWIELDRHELLDTRKVSLIGDDDSHGTALDVRLGGTYGCVKPLRYSPIESGLCRAFAENDSSLERTDLRSDVE